MIWAIAAFAIAPLPALAAPQGDLALGARVFEVRCAGCHPGGGNIVRRGKNLRQRALRRHGYDRLEAVVQLVTEGKNNMPAYGDRLSAEEIVAVSRYTLERAQSDWK